MRVTAALAAAATLLFSARSAAAQGGVIPVTPPGTTSSVPAEPGTPETTTPEPTPEPLVPAASRRTWRLGGDVSEVHETNGPALGADTMGEWGRRLNGSGDYSWALARGSVGVIGGISQIQYQSSGAFNQMMYNVGMTAGYAITPRLSWRFGESLSTTYAEDSAVISVALQYPRVVTRTNLAAGGISYMLSERNEVMATVAATDVLFKDSALIGGTSYAVNARFTRKVARRQSVGVFGGTTISSGASGDIQGLLGTWQGTFGRSLILNAALGVRPYTLPGVGGYQFAPGGSFGITGAPGAHQILSLTYERRVEQAYGIGGTHLSHGLNGGYNVTIKQRLALGGSLIYGLNQYPEDRNHSFVGITGTGEANLRLARNLALSSGYTRWYRHDSTTPATQNTRLTVGLSYGLGSRRR